MLSLHVTVMLNMPRDFYSRVRSGWDMAYGR